MCVLQVRTVRMPARVMRMMVAAMNAQQEQDEGDGDDDDDDE